MQTLRWRGVKAYLELQLVWDAIGPNGLPKADGPTIT